MTRLGQMATEVGRMNPWWRQRDRWVEDDRDLTEVRNSGLRYEPQTLDDLVEGGLYLLRGPRRVGKTISVKLKIQELINGGVNPLSITRVAVDGWGANDLRTLTQNVALPQLSAGSRRIWFIDEVTSVQGEWAQQIKWLRDNDSEFQNSTVVLTGSSASGLTTASGVLAGRRGRVANADRTLMPMGFRTFANTMNPSIEVPAISVNEMHSLAGREAFNVAVPWLSDLVRLWEIYIQYGGFPIAVAAALRGEEIPEWFINSIFEVIYRDAFHASTLSEAKSSALITRMWRSTSTPANLAAIGSDVGVQGGVVRRHVEYLRDSYLLWACPQLVDEWQANENAQDKLYPVDPVVGRLPFLRNATRADLDPTILTESQLGMSLRRSIHSAGTSWAGDPELFYVRSATRKEIDFVGPRLGGAAVEGKYTESGSWNRDAATVNASRYRGILATRNVLDTNAASAWAVPAAILAYCIDT